MLLKLPYGNTFCTLRCPEHTRVLTSRVDALQSDRPGAQLVAEAMAQPIGSPRLNELAKGRNSAVIILSDHTRPVPSRDILPAMLRELRAGSPAIDITLLVATGCHRPTTQAELIAKLGAEIVQNERILLHDSQDAAMNIPIGTLPSGAPLLIDKRALACDLLVAEGFIEPHFFAGFSGGRKSVLPGICGRATVLGNHCSAFIDDPRARTGVLEGNPLHRDMTEAARMAKLAYIVNVVIDESKRTVAAFAGEPVAAHAAGCAYLKKYCSVPPLIADIVITTNGGAPLDQNLYQCVKSLTAAEATAKPGAVLILCAQCADGVGGEDFFRFLRDCESPEALYESILATPQADTLPDQWQAQVLARVLRKHSVIVVCDESLKDTVCAMKLRYAPDAQTALDMALLEKGENADITALPNGISVIVEQN